MIQHRTFNKSRVYILSDGGINKATDISENKCGLFKAPSNTVIIEITDTSIRFVAGKDISEKIYGHILGLAIKQGKRLEMVNCESLSNLKYLDRLVAMYNGNNSLFI